MVCTLTREKTAGSRDHLETLTVVHLVPFTLRVTEDEAALLSSEEGEADPYSKSDKYPHPDTPTTRSSSVLILSTFLSYSLASRSTS